MSYEGYEVVLCANGHRHTFNCYDSPQLSPELKEQWDVTDYDLEMCWHCPDCNSFAVWWEGVDQTNDSGWITDLKEHTPEELSTCEHCDCSKKIKAAAYCIPSNQGHRVNRDISLNVPLAECSYIYNSYEPEG